jgi:signal transduction histidine kinase
VKSYIERDPYLVAAVELGGYRTIVAVPMLKDNELIGAITICRQAVQPFSDKQIALLTNFAAQAVIAIENARLLSELRQRTDDLSKSLEQQTATSEVLRVISSSPGDLQPVFEAMLANATRLCEAKFGILWLCEGDGFRSVALHNAPPAFAEQYQRQPVIHPVPGTGLRRLFETRQVAQVTDMTTIQPYIERDPFVVASVELGGYRSVINVPMLKENTLIGAISIYRQEVLPFTDKQIALVAGFAAQAVIAIENARLLSELRQRTDDLSQSLDNLRTAQDRLVQTEKLASLGQLTAGIAHEIKNPLNFVNNFSSVSVELIDELRTALGGVHLDDKQRTEINEIADMLQGNLDKVVQHGKRADSIVKNMLLHSRQGSGEHRPVDINAIVEESLNLAYHGARAEKQGFNITMERSFDPAAGDVDLFPQEITRVLLNLISNGFYAATKRKAETNGGDYEPALTAATRSLGDRVEIRIRDNGTGIPPEVRDKMFNPFFTTKPAGEGTGLGLSISHDIIVKQHGGSIEVDTQPGEFTEFRIVLPRGAATNAKSGERA